ncbi:L-asparaginase [Dactylella cylindrospora]|nr:L-asparaginase [Dactylella cylindrospora]
MVSRGYRKRCAGVFLLKHVKNPIVLAKELLSRDDGEVERGRQHNCLSGEYAEKMGEGWGVEVVDAGYFWTEKRWRQHIEDLKRRGGARLEGGVGFVDIAGGEGDGLTEKDDDEKTLGVEERDEDEDEEYLPKGTVGCVVLDNDGVIAVATSTGGLTNKVPGRIGDTPTPGAGYWAEEWPVSPPTSSHISPSTSNPLKSLLTSCLPLPSPPSPQSPPPIPKTHRAVGLSGTGNGDFFLRLSACHNITSRCRFGGLSLSQAAREVCGPGGEMERAGEGRKDFDGAVIGVDEDGEVVMEMNCGGCFRGTVDDDGRVLVAAYADEELEEWKEFD